MLYRVKRILNKSFSDNNWAEVCQAPKYEGIIKDKLWKTITDKFNKVALQHSQSVTIISETEGDFLYQQLEEYSNYIANELLCQK